MGEKYVQPRNQDTKMSNISKKDLGEAKRGENCGNGR